MAATIHTAGFDVWKIDPSHFPSKSTTIDKLQFILQFAILAPSNHNTQPWLFVFEDSKIFLYADRSRALPVADPEDHELIISCGVFLFFLKVALRNFGYMGEIDYFPDDPTGDLIATIDLGELYQPTEAEKQLFEAILHRRTCREKFIETKIPVDVQKKLSLVVDSTSTWVEMYTRFRDRKKIARIVRQADILQSKDKAFCRELAAWVHTNRTRSHDGMPAYCLGMHGIKASMGRLVIRSFDWGEGQAAKDVELAQGSPMILILGTRSNSFKDLVMCGEALGIMLLITTQHGISHSYLCQPLEVDKLNRKVASMIEHAEDIEDANELEQLLQHTHPQVILRLGFGPTVERSTPRRSVAECTQYHPPFYVKSHP